LTGGASTRKHLHRGAVAVVAAVTLAWGAPAAAQEPDPRIEQIRAAIAALSPLVQRPACDQVADPARWTNASPPDRGRADPVISAHRGAIELAPENTLSSYEYAFAYGVDLVEVDVQQTRDGRFVAMHDSTVDRTTEATGPVESFTYDELRRLNAADYEPWKGTEFDPARVASLEEILALAARVGGGIELDIKGSVTEEGRLAELVTRYGLIEESIFNSGDSRIFLVAPNANLIYNRDEWEPPFLLYEIGSVLPVFGSRLDEYTPEAIAAAHDACGIVMPHAYDAGPEQEVAQFLQARAIGADGVQTNQPDAIVAAAGQPARSTFETPAGEVCLVSVPHGLGFPAKTIELRKGPHAIDMQTGLGGCADVPARWRGAVATFTGDGAVLPARGKVIPG
jgi:glycerophosphoryl diester phosphodiesterase